MRLDDGRWRQLHGGYRVPFDPRPLLGQLESDADAPSAWTRLWEELHHQGDVGEASYAAVPHLVRIHIARGVPDWNTYALVATIDLARARGENPPLPSWLADAYHAAIRQLGEHGLRELGSAEKQELIISILAILAIWKGARTFGRIMAEFTESEVRELEQQAFGYVDE
jgi:hypothetical protein